MVSVSFIEHTYLAPLIIDPPPTSFYTKLKDDLINYSINDLINYLINDKSVYRTAPATTGLVNIKKLDEGEETPFFLN